MPYPYDYSYFKPTGKEQAAMGIGSLLAGLLSAAQPRQPGEASPVLKGIQGAVAGYGGGYKTYQDMMNEAYGRNLADRKFGQQVKEYEETDKPYKDSYARWNDAMAKNMDFDNQMAFDKLIQERLNAKKNERFNTRMNQLEMREMKNKVANSRTRRDTPLVSVNMGDAEKEEQKVIGRTFGESYQELQKDAQNARNEIDMFGTLKELSTQTETGKLEPFKTQLAGYAQSLGVPINDRYNANQMFEAISNKLTVMARKVGEGQILAGQISDSDREFLKRSVPELGKLPEANKMLIDWNLKLANRRVELSRLGEEYYNKNGTMKGFNEARSVWVSKNPLFPATIIPQTNSKESVLQELFDLAQKGDPEALQFFRSKGIK